MSKIANDVTELTGELRSYRLRRVTKVSVAEVVAKLSP